MVDSNIPTKPIVLGEIGSCYGVRGWIRVFSSTEEAENIFNYQPWFIQRPDRWEKVELENWRRHHQEIVIKLKSINDRNAANLLTNYEIIIDASQLPKLKDGDYYWKDLIGCCVINTKNYFLGTVINIIKTGSNDVLVIQSDLKDSFFIKKRLVPFLDKKVIKKVELITQTIKVDWDPRF